MSKMLVSVSLALVLVACGDDDSGGGGTGGAQGGAAAQGTGGTGSGGTGTGGAAGPTSCGGTMCSPVPAELQMFQQTCCTPSNECGIVGATTSNVCTAVSGRDDSMCPDAMILGNVAEGCCTMDGVRCGIVDTITGSGCIARESVPIMPLPAINCDGTMPTQTGDAGM